MMVGTRNDLGETDMKREGEQAQPALGRPVTLLISLCAVLITLSALDALFLASPDGFLAWQTLYPQTVAADYSAFLLTRFLLDILVPAALALYTFLTIRKLGIPSLYRLVWGALIFVAAMWKILALETSSPLWYLSLALWLGLFLIVINLHRFEGEKV